MTKLKVEIYFGSPSPSFAAFMLFYVRRGDTFLACAETDALDHFPLLVGQVLRFIPQLLHSLSLQCALHFCMKMMSLWPKVMTPLFPTDLWAVKS